MSDMNTIWTLVIKGVLVFFGLPMLLEMCTRAIFAGKLKAQREHFQKLKQLEESYGQEEASEHGRKNKSKS